MRASVRILTLLAWFVVVPTAAFAQAVIAGTVKDPSGAVLPGVVVEAASPALIEKVRIAVTDSSAGGSATIVITTSARAAASAGDVARLAPRSTSGFAFSAVLFHTTMS